MKKILILLFFIVATFSIVHAGDLKLESLKDKVSYSFGQQMGANLKAQEIDINFEIFIASLRSAIEGRPPQLAPKEMQKTIIEFQKHMRLKRQAKLVEFAKKNYEEGKAYLELNKNKSGVKVTKSGLQYKIIKEGKGRSPTLNDVVEIHYKGTFIDGREFDSSYKRKQTSNFLVTGVIKGWTEALQLMKEGGKWELVIPSTLAYGSRGGGQMIGPNATLIFEIELVAVKDKPGLSPDSKVE